MGVDEVPIQNGRETHASQPTISPISLKYKAFGLIR